LTTKVSEKHLSLWEEIVGVCSEIREEDNEILILLRVDNKVFRILLRREFVSQHLKELLEIIRGKKIGILRTDNPEKPYVIRIVRNGKTLNLPGKAGSSERTDT